MQPLKRRIGVNLASAATLAEPEGNEILVKTIATGIWHGHPARRRARPPGAGNLNYEDERNEPECDHSHCLARASRLFDCAVHPRRAALLRRHPPGRVHARRSYRDGSDGLMQIRRGQSDVSRFACSVRRHGPRTLQLGTSSGRIHFHYHMIRGAELLRRTIDSVLELRLRRANLTNSFEHLKTSWRHIRSASIALPGFSLVELDGACCSMDLKNALERDPAYSS